MRSLENSRAPTSSIQIKRILKTLSVSPRKSRGQNFLINLQAAKNIAASMNISSGDDVLEIGPGLGILSEQLLQQTTNLRLVEIEPKFCEFLKERFPEINEIICNDIRKIDLSLLEISHSNPSSPIFLQPIEIIITDENSTACVLKKNHECFDGVSHDEASIRVANRRSRAKKFVVVGNIPYSITTDILFWIFSQWSHISRAHLLVQKEFAKRLAAEPASKDYGSITILRMIYADAYLGDDVNEKKICLNNISLHFNTPLPL